MKMAGKQGAFEFGDEEIIFEETPEKGKKKKTISFATDDVVWIDINLIDNHPLNKSIYFSDEEFDFLKMLIHKYGLFDSNIVCKSEDNGRYTILSGHRRIQATRELIQENLILQTKVPIHIKNFDSKDEEVAFIIQMNSSSRERNDIDKLNEIFQFSYTLKIEKSSVSDQEIVNQLLNVVKLGESQLKKYLRLFKSVEWNREEVNRLFIEYENINRWDKTREIDQKEIKAIDTVTHKKQTTFEGNELYKIKPTQKVRDMVDRIFNYFDKAERSIIDLSKQNELSREGVKSIRALSKSIVKNKEAILKFNADVKGDSNEN